MNNGLRVLSIETNNSIMSRFVATWLRPVQQPKAPLFLAILYVS